MMLCLHHNDLDGRCSAAIVKLAHPGVRCIELDYAARVPFEDIPPRGTVFVVDFSLQTPGDWEKLRSITENIIWIDHHETALKKAPREIQVLPGIRDTSKCGCLLTWEYCMRQSVPRVIELIDAWDRWVHNDDPGVLNFVSGMKLEDQRPESALWPALLTSAPRFDVLIERELDRIKAQGCIVRQYEKQDNAETVSRYAYSIMLDGYRCLACNSVHRNSLVFDSIPVADRPDIFIAYVHDGKKYTVSLYSVTVKVNDLAAKYGGGGHPSAAGFVCERLPW
jgi:oligoribonuclease NrnB/cAMP/cGMP phosphodiesterase (DHH superfamily)